MRKFNELKKLVLRTIEKYPGSTSESLASSIGISVPSAQMALIRLFRQKLVERRATIGLYKKRFEYIINQRGVQRLDYLTR